MLHTTLVCVDTVKQHINNPNWIIIDCRFSLMDNEAGAKAYRMGHIPNAHYAHIEKDLSSAITSHTGRHPLPTLNSLVKKLGSWGISNKSQIIVYDDAYGAFAGRLWWLLRYLGHDAVAVLDGGVQHWQSKQLPLTTTLPSNKPRIFRPYTDISAQISAEQLSNQLAFNKIKLIDARTAERFSGQSESIDPIAGHIPKAINHPFQLNLNTNGLFLSKDKLHSQFSHLLGTTSPENTVHMCGSGITACHNLLAMEHAGLNGSKLYPGSWSDWITNQNRSIATNHPQG